MGIRDVIRRGLGLKPKVPEITIRYEAAPIIDDADLAEPGQSFRLPDDEVHVIRFRRDQPKGYPRRLAEWVKVAGISHDPYMLRASKFIAASGQRLELEREPRNPHDRNAIAVIGVWQSLGGLKMRRQLGYVPADVAEDIAKRKHVQRLAAVLHTMYIPVDGKSPGIQFDIWAPRGPARRPKRNIYVID